MFACQNDILRFVKFTNVVMIVSEFAIEHALASPNVSALFWRENTLNLNKQLSIVARNFINKGFSAFTAVVRPLAEVQFGSCPPLLIVLNYS